MVDNTAEDACACVRVDHDHYGVIVDEVDEDSKWRFSDVIFVKF